jgi:hypothetical protein
LVAEANQCIPPSLFVRHSAGDGIGDPHLDVRLKLIVDFLLVLGAGDFVLDAAKDRH